MSKEPLRPLKTTLVLTCCNRVPLFERAIRRLTADRIEGQVNIVDDQPGAIAVVDSERKPVSRNVALIVDATEGLARSEASAMVATP